jgi:hypothetical protein
MHERALLTVTHTNEDCYGDAFRHYATDTFCYSARR